MTLAPIILCRMDSRRLPGKVLAVIRDRTLLDLIIDRLEQTGGFDHPPVIATTDRSVDDLLAGVADRRGLPCVRGACEDVAGRLLLAAERLKLTWFARVNGDSPWVDPELLSQAAALRDDADFVTNLAPRRFPTGIAVELIRTTWYRAVADAGWFSDAAAREHPTSALYRSLSSFGERRLRTLSPPTGCTFAPAEPAMTIDVPPDLERCRRVANGLGDEWWRSGWQGVAARYAADLAEEAAA